MAVTWHKPGMLNLFDSRAVFDISNDDMGPTHIYISYPPLYKLNAHKFNLYIEFHLYSEFISVAVLYGPW